MENKLENIEYQDIKTPNQLLEYMDNIKYGFVDEIGKEYVAYNDDFQIACKTKWRLSSPDRLLKVKYGHCWDQTEFEREWFEKHGYSFKTFYIWFELPYENSYSTHTYLVFEKDGKYYYFEHSDFHHRGIYEFNTYEEAITYQKEKFIEMNKKRNSVTIRELKHLHIYEYSKPTYGLSMSGFIDYILTTGKKIK